MPYCEHATIVKERPGRAALKPLRCKSWSCPDCAPRRRKRLIRETCGGNPTIFLTLTKRHNPDETREEAARALVSAWRRLRRHLMHKHNRKDLPFMAVFEPHKSGKPHLHIFIRARFIPIRDITTWMAENYDAPIQDIRSLKNKALAAAYAGKYITKSNTRFGTCKRYWKSRDYETDPGWRTKSPRPADETVRVSWENLSAVLAAYERAGWIILQQGGGLYLALSKAEADAARTASEAEP